MLKHYKHKSYLLQLQKEDYRFFPTNRALSLATDEQHAMDVKLDILTEKVNILIEKQKEQVCCNISS